MGLGLRTVPPYGPSQDAEAAAGGRRPLLLALVYGVFLVLVGVTASGLVAVAGAHIKSAALQAVVGRDHSLVELFVAGRLEADDLTYGGPSATRAAELAAQLADADRKGRNPAHRGARHQWAGPLQR